MASRGEAAQALGIGQLRREGDHPARPLRKLSSARSAASLTTTDPDAGRNCSIEVGLLWLELRGELDRRWAPARIGICSPT